MSQYQHAAKIKRYAQDAAETAEPWKRWNTLVNGEVAGPCDYPICDFSSVIRIARGYAKGTPHPRAELLMQLAKDYEHGGVSPLNWEEYCNIGGKMKWVRCVESYSLLEILHMIQGPYREVRRWTARIEINGHEIPYLANIPIEENQTVFYPDLVIGVSGFTWDGSDVQMRMLGQKLLHSTSEEAKLHYQALTSF